MYPDIIAIAIPIMIGCVAVEFVHDWRQRRANYRINAAASNMLCGAFEQVTGFISKGLFIGLYLFIYEHWRLATLADSFWVWLALIVLVDLVFYGFHRFSHRCSLLWSGHMVHHEIEEFNLTVALRRSVMQEFTIIGVYLPFAFLGFSPGAFFLAFAAHNLYQFLIHSPYLPEFKTLGLVFNTPHHHAIHHCRNACYIDKNFAGVFIVWDKLFGTFCEHSESPEYGVGQRTTTLNPVKAQVTTLAAVLREARRRSGWRDKMRALFGPPDYLSDEALPVSTAPDAPPRRRLKFDPQLSRRQWWVLGWSFGAMAIVTSVYRNIEGGLPTAQRVFVLAVFIAWLYAMGRLLDNRGPQPAQLADTGAAGEGATT